MEAGIAYPITRIGVDRDGGGLVEEEGKVLPQIVSFDLFFGHVGLGKRSAFTGTERTDFHGRHEEVDPGKGYFDGGGCRKGNGDLISSITHTGDLQGKGAWPGMPEFEMAILVREDGPKRV